MRIRNGALMAAREVREVSRGNIFFLVPVEVKKVAAPVIIKRTVWVGAQRLCQSVSWGCN